MERALAIRLDNTTRRFGDIVAVSEATVELVPGEIHAIVGENGAGKSTLLKMAAGHLAPSEGKVIIGERELVPATPMEATRRSVGMVHQHFMLVGAFRAIENLILGAEPVKGVVLDEEEAMRRGRELAARVGLEVRLDAPT